MQIFRGWPLTGLYVFSSLLTTGRASLLPVQALPGAEDGAPSGEHFSGYLNVSFEGSDMRVFGYFAPHPDPSAPLIVWMNGGPGASSLMGLFGELGPFLLNSMSMPKGKREDWRLFGNPHGWHTVGSLLAWEQPAGVGFSHCEAPSACPVWDDDSSARANFEVLSKFFEEHPAERSRDLIIAGESYGGIYVPMLAQQVLLHNQALSSSPAIRLRSIAVGNGCVGFDAKGGCGIDTLETIVSYLEQGAPGIDREALAQVRNDCGDGQLSAGAAAPEDVAQPCRGALHKLWMQLGHYNMYNFDSPCGPSEQGNWGDGDAFACGTHQAMTAYLTSAAAQRALNVIPDESDSAVREWQMWDGDWDGYNITASNVLGVYEQLLHAGIEVLVYNGLRDTSLPVTGAEAWTKLIGGKLKETRRTWAKRDGEAAGDVVTYASGLTFATVRGAGHLVPGDRPQAAHTMIEAFARGEPLPSPSGTRCSQVWMGRGYADFCNDVGRAGFAV